MIGKYLDVSTANITPATMDMIEQGQLGVSSMAGPYGAFVAVLDDRMLERGIVHEVDLYPIFEKARELGCGWILFDRDADLIDGLPDYTDQWENISMKL